MQFGFNSVIFYFINVYCIIYVSYHYYIEIIYLINVCIISLLFIFNILHFSILCGCCYCGALQVHIKFAARRHKAAINEIANIYIIHKVHIHSMLTTSHSNPTSRTCMFGRVYCAFDLVIYLCTFSFCFNFPIIILLLLLITIFTIKLPCIYFNYKL